jgi:hypothetical protein
MSYPEPGVSSTFQEVCNKSPKDDFEKKQFSQKIDRSHLFIGDRFSLGPLYLEL